MLRVGRPPAFPVALDFVAFKLSHCRALDTFSRVRRRAKIGRKDREFAYFLCVRICVCVCGRVGISMCFCMSVAAGWGTEGARALVCTCICVCVRVYVCVPDWPQGPEPSRFMRYGKVRGKHLLAQRKALVWDSYWVWAVSTHTHTHTHTLTP